MDDPMKTDSNFMTGQGLTGSGSALEWDTEDQYWRGAFLGRPYVGEDDAPYDRYRPGYRLGFEAAQQHRGRSWKEVEPELQLKWKGYEHKHEDHDSKWDDIKHAVRDSWDRATGKGHSDDR